MKKVLMLIALLAMIIVPAIAQTELPPTPETPWEAIGQFAFLIGSFPGVVALMFFLIPFVLGGLNITGKVLKYLFTVLCVLGLTLAAYFLGFGYLHGTFWWTIPLNVALLMLIQIGIFTWEFAKNIQEKLYEKFNPWKPVT